MTTSNDRMNQVDDNQLIDQVLGGDRSAFAILVNRHKNMVYSIALRISQNREDAEEVAQDTFMKAYSSLNSFEKKSKFSTWLYRIVYNAAITKTRKKKIEFVNIDDRLIASYSEDEIHNHLGVIDADEKKLVVDKALGRLSDEDNLLITLFYKDGNSVGEICEITGLSMSNVKVRLHRIRKKLYSEISEIMSYQVVF